MEFEFDSLMTKVGYHGVPKIPSYYDGTHVGSRFAKDIVFNHKAFFFLIGGVHHTAHPSFLASLLLLSLVGYFANTCCSCKAGL